jgi:hypothetical protein
MLNLTNIVKLSGFAIAVASMGGVALAQPVQAPARPSAAPAQVAQPLTTVMNGQPLNVVVQNATANYVRAAKLDATQASALQRGYAAALAKMEREGVKITPAVAQSTFAKVINEVVGKAADSAAQSQMASAAFTSAISAKTTAADVASGIVSSVSNTADATSTVTCDLLSSMAGKGADGMISKNVDVTSAKAIADLRTEALDKAKKLDAHFTGGESLEVTSYSLINGKPAVTATANSPYGAVSIFTSAASQGEDSVAVLQGLNGVLETAVEVSNGLGRDLSGSAFVSAVWGAVEQKLASTVGADEAANIVFGPIADLNGDGKIDASERASGKRGEMVDGKLVASGLAGHCSTAVLGARP